jgi:hypothetical protein
MIDTDTEVLVDLEVEVRWIHAVIGPDQPNLLPLANLLALPDIDSV